MKTAVEIRQYVALMRRGGRVKRFHTIQLIGEQSIASHSFGVAALCLALTQGEASGALIRAALHHDIEEQETGDVPAQAKWACAELKGALTQLEEEFRYRHRLDRVVDTGSLSEAEALTLSWADGLELYLTCVDQALLGNQFVRPIKAKIYGHLLSLPYHRHGVVLLQGLEGGGGYDDFCS